MIFGTYTILKLKLFLLIIGINFPKKSMSIGELELINFNVFPKFGKFNAKQIKNFLLWKKYQKFKL